MLEKVKSPQDLKELSVEELGVLAGEIRENIIDTVSKNGGHLASNLGIVEVTLALHKVFSSPEDAVIFDVGHQSYAHKLVTGRAEEFPSLRQKGGVSGFQRRGESEHDRFSEGHSGSSLSQALGLAEANKLLGSSAYTVAVVGDGSLTNGMIYEALNNCGEKEVRLLIVVNDNDMSISRNIGGVHNHLTKIRTSKRYFSFKYRVERILRKIPLIGKPIEKTLRAFKRLLKNIFVRNTLFEDMGVKYYGPIDGHNLKKLVNIFQEARSHERISVVNVKTQKGKGYPFAEEEPQKYHSVAPFDREKGIAEEEKDSFTRAAGEYLCEKAEHDSRICALTAAMCEGTGLTEFAKRYPDRFFDVGIAEEHAVAFAGGLSASGMKPVLVLYSTFAQRVYDQILHDVSLQDVPLTLLLDHCGFVDGDGITHQGLFDVSLFSSVPNTQIYSPGNYRELREAIDGGLNGNQITIVRYPKGEEFFDEEEDAEEDGDFVFTRGIEEAETVVFAYGRTAVLAREAQKRLGARTGVVRLKKIYPVDFCKLDERLKNMENLYVLEEGYLSGGIGEKIAAAFAGKVKRARIHAVNGFVGQGTTKELFGEYGFTPEDIVKEIEEAFKDE